MSFVFNGVSSDAMKFNVTSRQVYNAPAYDLNAIEVPGRSGDLLNPQNRFKNKQISYTGFLKASDFEGSTWREKLSTGLIQLKGWLCSDAGQYHELTDDYDPGFTRYGYISGETAISDVQDRPFGVTLTVTFNCKPFMYKAGEPMELPETKSASGDIITITDGAENTPLKSAVVNIEPVQDLHGYDYPWPAGGEVNKYPIAIGEDVWVNNANATHSNSDGELLIVCAAQSNSGVYGNGQQRALLNQQSVAKTVSMDIKASVAMSVTVQGNIKDVTTSYQRISVAIAANTSASLSIYGRGTAGTIYVKNVAITEDGSTTYSPYSNICPISGWSEVKVTRTGVNLLPAIDTVTRNGITLTNNNGKYTLSGTATAATNFDVFLPLPIAEGTKISMILHNESASSGVLCYTQTAQPANINGLACSVVGQSGTFTLTADLARFRLRVNSGTALTNFVIAPMIVLGDARPTFEPYQGVTKSIPLGQTVYGGTLDVVRGKLNAKPYYASYSGQTLVGPWISSHDKYVAGATPTTGAQVVDMGATGTDYDVTPQIIKTLLGVNNIWADAGEMSIEYPIPTENPYPFGSRPLYEITMAGTGTLVVNGKEWTITDYTGTLYCDTEAMEWYDASQLRNNIVSGDGWPVFEAGENSVSYTGDITKVMVTPRWRTL